MDIWTPSSSSNATCKWPFETSEIPFGLLGQVSTTRTLKTGVFSRKSNTLTIHDISTGRLGLSWPEKLNENVDSGTIFYINNTVSLCSLCHLNFNDRLNLGLFDLDYFFLTKRSTTCHHSWVLRWWLDHDLIKFLFSITIHSLRFRDTCKLHIGFVSLFASHCPRKPGPWHWTRSRWSCLLRYGYLHRQRHLPSWSHHRSAHLQALSHRCQPYNTRRPPSQLPY